MCQMTPERFNRGATPPIRDADDDWFEYEPTHVVLRLKQGGTYASMGDQLLSALYAVSDDVMNFILKDAPEGKFSMKATTCIEDSACRLKVKVYQEPDADTCVADFMHLLGDADTFETVFNKVVRHLFSQAKDFEVLSPEEPPPEPRTWSAALLPNVPINDVYEILDTPGVGEAEDLQVMLATALARHTPAPDDKIHRIQEILSLLMWSNNIQVMWPTMRSVEKMSAHYKQTNAKELINKDLRTLLQDRLSLDTTSTLVKDMMRKMLTMPEEKHMPEVPDEVPEEKFEEQWVDPDDVPSVDEKVRENIAYCRRA